MRFELILAGVLCFSCGGPMMMTDAGSGGGGGGAAGGGTVTGGGGGGTTDAGRCQLAPPFVAAELFGKAGFDLGGPMSPPFNYATMTRPSATSGRTDLMFNEVYSAAPIANVAIPPKNYQQCDPCFLIETGCNAMGAMCSKHYLARAGTLSVSAASKNVDAGTYAFTLSNVSYEEWNFTADTSVPDGGCLRLQNFAFSGSWP